jgi:hypothetical protein
MSENTNTTDVSTEIAPLVINEPVETEQTEAPQYPNLTPFQACMVARKVLDNPNYQPQTFYTMAKSGAIASNYAEFTARGGRGHGLKVMFDGSAFAEWLKAAKAGTASTGSRQSIESLAEAFEV